MTVSQRNIHISKLLWSTFLENRLCQQLQACVDLVYAAGDGASLIQRIESRNGIHTIEHAAEIGLGRREYCL